MKARWLFFTYFASLAFPGRFFSIFYEEHALDETHIGVLLATAPLITMFCAPVVCNLADRTGRRKDVTLITYSGAISAFLAQIFAIPSLNLISIENRFPFLLILRIVHSACHCASYPLVSAITISQLKHQYGHKGHERFGHERLWGAISWAGSSLILGVLLDLTNAKLWLIHGGCLLFGILFLCTLYRFKNEDSMNREMQSDGQADCVEKSAEVERGMTFEETDDLDTRIESGDRGSAYPFASNVKAVSRILCSDGIVAPLFFNLIFWLAAGMSLVENLLFLFFENELQASNLLCGLSVVVTVLIEIPIFAKAPELLEKIGASILAMIGSSSFVFRGIGYSLSPNGWVALLNEPFHGITFGAFHTATVAYIAERCPSELEATGQSVLQIVQSLGRVVGTSTGGYIMQRFGSKMLYRGAALLVLTATIAFGIVDRASEPSRRESILPFEAGDNVESNNEKMILTTTGD